MIAKGSDPLEQRERRNTLTLADIAEMFIIDVKLRRKPKTEKLYRQTLRKHVLPTLGNRLAEEVKQREVIELHEQIGGTSGQAIANTMLRVISSLYTWAALRDKVNHDCNPARRMGRIKFKELPRSRLLTPDEIRRIETAIENATMGDDARVALRVLMLTGCRLNEVLRLKWSDVDFERGTVWLRDTKTGDHRIALTDTVREILGGVERREDIEFIFPAKRGGHALNKPRADDLKRPWQEVCSRADLTEVHLHDLRHAWASTAIAAGVSPMVLSRAMRHSSVKMTEIYSHLAPNAVSDAQRLVDAAMANVMGLRPTANNVVRLSPTKQ